jgi:hypothetical protein
LDTHKRKKIDTSEDALPSKKAKKSRLEASSANNPITPTLVRKKSVTFTPETKIEDGDSIKQLFNSWVIEQKSQDPSFELKASTPVFNTPEPSQIEEQIDPSLPEKERRVKRVKNPKEKKSNQSKDTGLPQQSKSAKPSKIVKPLKPSSRPFLSYLRQYSEDKPNWKFNKNHQNHIIKNIFDINVIPSDHAHFIYEYVRGLQGGVRTRLRDTALSVKDMEEDYSMYVGDEARKKREIEAAEKEYVATQVLANARRKIGYEEGVLVGLSDYAMKGRMAKRVRAEEILKELAENGGTGITETMEENSEDGESQKRLRKSDGTSQKRARGRKQRTMVENVESSSEDDSSDSDASPPPPRQTSNIHYNQDESTSSSSPSTNPSGSEEDDDSEDDDDSEEDSDEDSEESDSE